MNDGAIPALFALAQHDPSFFEGLTPLERAILPHMWAMWLRPDQVVPDYDWRYHGWVGGRGYGKSLGLSVEFNARVRTGRARAPALMAPTDERVNDVQVRFLIDTSPPWFKAERYKGTVRWPNGVQAEAFTPEAPGRSRSGNFDLTWLCEIVDWNASGRLEAFKNLTTATRVGAAQVLWDTTSKGKNEVIQHLETLNKADPYHYPITRGTSFHNPLLGKKYLASLCAQYTGRRYKEEVLGMIFAESAGAYWEQAWLDNHRRQMRPTNPDVTLVGVDPGLSDHKTADACGLIAADRGKDGHVYIWEDASAQMKPNTWGDWVVEQCQAGAAGAVVERNHLGDHATYVIRSRAENAGMQVRVLAKDKPFPRRAPGIIYVREVVSRDSKGARAEGPASETEAGRVHLVGQLDSLELELTTWEPGRRSPNRLDAACQAVSELRGLALDKGPRGAAQDAQAAATAARELNRRLASVMSPGRMGL